jgi:hypothetical protein
MTSNPVVELLAFLGTAAPLSRCEPNDRTVNA